jgi:virulence factor Mce-like protein
MKHVTRRFHPERIHRRAAIVVVVGLVLGTLLVFLKSNPFAGGYELRGVFSSVNQLKGGSEVRIAGLRVGKVRAIEAGPGRTAIVTMRIEDTGRPIYADATLAVKPRLLLEGNAYIDLRPGRPNAPELSSGTTIPLSRTAVTPQLDQVLDVFDLPTRGALHRAIAELATGLGAGGARRAGAPTGVDGLRRAVRELDAALGSVTRVAGAARGTRPGDLARAIGGSADVTSQLARHPHALGEMVTNFNRVTWALAAHDRALAASVSGFDDVLKAAPATLTALDGALPTLTKFGDALRPTLHAAPDTLRKTNLLLHQVRALMRRSELAGLVDGLEPVTANLPALERDLQTLFGLVKPVTDCITTHVVPTLDTKIEDGPHTTGDPVWLDLLHAFTGFSSFSSAVDGNGGTVRLGVTGGEQTVSGVIPGLGRVAGMQPEAPMGVRPTWLGYGVEPPYRPDLPCADQKQPDLGARSGPPPNWRLSPATPRLRKKS